MKEVEFRGNFGKECIRLLHRTYRSVLVLVFPLCGMSNAVNFYVFAIFMLNITKSQKLIKFCFLNQFSGQFFSPEDMIFGHILNEFQCWLLENM